jgi:cell volume regulation protein A
VKWKVAKPVSLQAGLLSTGGVVITAFLTALFCFFVLRFNWIESFLIGAIMSSTDAASVFSILKSKNLNLKDGTASILELESGSNDPVAYMLTIIGLTLATSTQTMSVGYMLFAQIVYGVALGVGIGLLSVFVLQKMKLVTEGLEAIFVIGVVLSAYAVPTLIGGNGYLSVYLTGIILGNSAIKNKVTLVHFFDGLTGLAQILIFFLLGLLAFPRQIPTIAVQAVLIGAFLLLVARPVATFLLLRPFKASKEQCMLISFAGLRGASSIVFAIMVIASDTFLKFDIFHIVFFVALLSVSLQGSLLPFVAKKLNMVDEQVDVRKTFTDYQEEAELTLMRFFVPQGHNWENKKIEGVNFPTGSLALMIKRNGETLIPKGNTEILAGDTIILSVPGYKEKDGVAKLKEVVISKNHKWYNKKIQELNLPPHVLIAMIKRGEQNIIPRGKTRVEENDIVVIYK